MPNITILNLCLAFIFLQKPVTTKSRELIREDMDAFVRTVPQLPCSTQEVHRLYTKTTKHGEEFSYSGTFTTLFEKVNIWIARIHDEAIKRRIREHPRKDMIYKVQYDDEKLKLTLRPLAGPQVVKKTAAFSTTAKDLVAQLVQLEKSFDWQNYYKQYDNFQKELIHKNAQWESKNQQLQDEIPMVQTEYGLQKDEKMLAAVSKQMMKERTQYQNVLFNQHCVAWSTCFQKYGKGVTLLQHLLQNINYGQQLSAEEQKTLLPFMADVQARALESIERMIWMEMNLLERGEVLFNEQRIGNFFMGQ